MSFTENGGNEMIMPVAPLYGNGNGNNGWGGDGWWVILFLFALMGNGGWGNGFGGGNNGLFPYFTATNTDAGVQRGFDTATITSQLSGINTSINNGFANAEVAGCNRAMDAMQTEYSNQIASMNQNFANQQAIQQTLFNMQQAQSECCCENRLATCQTQNIVQNEGNATRFADANNTRDLITNQTANTQAILDKLCQLELDGYKRENDNLRSQLNMSNLAASQVAQTAQITRGQRESVDALVNELRSCPIPAQPVYGSQPIFTCPQSANSGCGCGQF